ncbi:MAG: hypothetical protein JWQ35_1058 [Bacteriovoracaceae bacterium]|nr:hypothetical protein [Bacteriovoracaceae bacterium]
MQPNIRFIIALIFAGNFLAPHLYSEIISERSEEFINDPAHCKKNNSCSLKSFKLLVREVKSHLVEYNEDHFNTKIIATYRTTSVDTLEDYAFVQFIRGCRFDSTMENEVVKKTNDWGSMTSFGKSMTSRFPNWTIDSEDSDPVYNSNSERADRVNLRHFLYRWNTVPNSFDRTTQKFFGEEKPIDPSLYVSDLTGSAYYVANGFYRGTAFNNSYQLKMCIFKTKEIPLATVSNDIYFAAPIKCFDWQNSLVYNYASSKFETPKAIDPFCLQK